MIKNIQNNTEELSNNKNLKLDWSLLSTDELYALSYKEQVMQIKDRMKTQTTENEKNGLFNILTANEWLEKAKKTPIPLMLFSELWHENEVCILFADTNVGKSILAVQIGDSISKGKPINGFKLEAKSQPVLYFDFELSAKQFEIRYSVKNEKERIYENHYSFDDNFKRIELNPDADIPDEVKFDDYLNQCIEESIISTNSKILIIDNITYLKSETEKAKDASPLMKHLKTLKESYGISILVLAHTPKRDSSKPLNLNDLAGSKMLSNFIDSCFAIGVSNLDSELRYIKQLKARNTTYIYDEDNVAVCQLNKPSNFLGFSLVSFSTEQEHLKQISNDDKDNRISEVLNLKKQGASNVQIARKFGVSEGAIRKWIKKHNKIEG